MRVIAKSLGEYNACTLHVGLWPRVRKRIQFIINIRLFSLGGYCLSRVKNIIKRVGETCTIVVCYAPVIAYVYSYVLFDSVIGRTDSNMTK